MDFKKRDSFTEFYYHEIFLSVFFFLVLMKTCINHLKINKIKCFFFLFILRFSGVETKLKFDSDITYVFNLKTYRSQILINNTNLKKKLLKD